MFFQYLYNSIDEKVQKFMLNGFWPLYVPCLGPRMEQLPCEVQKVQPGLLEDQALIDSFATVSQRKSRHLVFVCSIFGTKKVLEITTRAIHESIQRV